jgi:hypothetical protein
MIEVNKVQQAFDTAFIDFSLLDYKYDIKVKYILYSTNKNGTPKIDRSAVQYSNPIFNFKCPKTGEKKCINYRNRVESLFSDTYADCIVIDFNFVSNKTLRIPSGSLIKANRETKELLADFKEYFEDGMIKFHLLLKEDIIIVNMFDEIKFNYRELDRSNIYKIYFEGKSFIYGDEYDLETVTTYKSTLKIRK